MIRGISVFVIAGVLLGLPDAASAQLSRVGGSVSALVPGGIMRGTDTAYDPAHGVYLLVVGNGPIYGVFVNVQGVPVTAPFTIMTGAWGHFPRAKYSPDILGGQGGFLVTWHHNIDAAGNLLCVFGRVVAYTMPGGLVTGIQQISDGSQLGTWHETGPAMAYSRTSRRFLVGWRTKPYGIQGRFVDVNGAPVGAVLNLESPGGSRDPALAWNPATDEFGLVYTGFGSSGAFAAFRRVRASDGFVWGRTSFGFSAGTFATAIDVNSSNQYVLAWSLHPGTMTATFDANGTQLTNTFATSRLGFDQSLAMAFNATTGTILAVSSDSASYEVGGLELTSTGAPNSTAQVLTDGARLGSFYPMTTARSQSNQWDIVYSRDFQGATSQIVQTSSAGGSAPPPPPPPPTSGGCTTPDPFVSLGGGRCVNGGWLPPAGGTAPPPPPSSGCTTPDPFASIGGGTCVNGGWRPRSSGGTAPAPAPPPPSSGCTSPDPFAAIGGGSCVNGGWVPRVSSCGTPDPFASLGGGICVNGGWVPRGSAVTGCATPDPFASLGGGNCVNGGWVPRTSSCTTPDPFASLGGGTCVNGGWRPRASLDDRTYPLGSLWDGLAGDSGARSLRRRTRDAGAAISG